MSITEVVLAVDQRRWDAMIGNDVDTLDEVLHPSLVYTHSNGLVDTKDSYLKSLRDGVVRYLSAERTETAVIEAGSTAMITGKVTFSVHAFGRDFMINSRYLAVWIEERGQWRFVAWQNTPLPEKP